MRLAIAPRVCCLHLILLFASCVAQPSATSLVGSDFALRSTGDSSGGAWILDRNGYVGTYLTLSTPGTVKIDVSAEGTSDPMMNVVVCDTKFPFAVSSEAKTYSGTLSLPAGTHFLRIELANDRGDDARQLQINRVNVSGAEFANDNTNENALAASDNYIANYRKGRVTVDLSALGIKAGEKVDVKLHRIAFDFGAGIHSDVGGVSSLLGIPFTSQQRNYQRHFEQNFNTIVTAGPSYWGSNEPVEGQVTMTDTNEVFDFAAVHNMHTRLHNLIWETNQPDWVDALKKKSVSSSESKARLASAIKSRIGYYVGNKDSQFNEIDVYNESYNSGQEGDSSTYWNLLGPSGIADIYHRSQLAGTAAGYAPKLFVNEYGVLQDAFGTGNGFAKNLESLRQAGAEAGYSEVVGGIGLQLYDGKLRSDLATEFIAALELMNVEGLPLVLTEFGTFTAVSPADSAMILGESMRLMFGNPDSTGFIVWEWTKQDDGSDQWAPNAALYNVSSGDGGDYTLTPAGKQWQDTLGIQDWNGNPADGWTTKLTTTVAPDGTIAFDGYYGDYQLTTGGKIYEITLKKGDARYSLGPNAAAVVPDP